jgi:hypothetical protein
MLNIIVVPASFFNTTEINNYGTLLNNNSKNIEDFLGDSGYDF